MFLVLSQGRAAASEETGTIRAKAVRIRGSPESAYPFMKGSPAPWTDLACSQREWHSLPFCEYLCASHYKALSAPEASFAERQEMLTDLSGIEEWSFRRHSRLLAIPISSTKVVCRKGIWQSKYGSAKGITGHILAKCERSLLPTCEVKKLACHGLYGLAKLLQSDSNSKFLHPIHCSACQMEGSWDREQNLGRYLHPDFERRLLCTLHVGSRWGLITCLVKLAVSHSGVVAGWFCVALCSFWAQVHPSSTMLLHRCT